MNKYPTNNEEYLRRCPALDGADKYGLKQNKEWTHEEHQRRITVLKEIRAFLSKPYEPS